MSLFDLKRKPLSELLEDISKYFFFKKMYDKKVFDYTYEPDADADFFYFPATSDRKILIVKVGVRYVRDVEINFAYKPTQSLYHYKGLRIDIDFPKLFFAIDKEKYMPYWVRYDEKIKVLRSIFRNFTRDLLAVNFYFFIRAINS